jgi:hypothetical protein
LPDPKFKPVRSAASWFGNRLNGGVLGRVNAITAETVKSAARRIRVEEISAPEARTGFEGRYPDGGATRFAQMVAQKGLDASQLDAKKKDWERQARLFFAVALLALGIPPVWIMLDPGPFAFLMIPVGLLIGAGLLGMGVRASFSAWQIGQRRFGGLREFLFG